MGKLKAEGFVKVYVWEDDAVTYYPDHTHDKLSAHIIVEGEMAITMDGKTFKVKSGGRFDVPAYTVHSAKIGERGCRYIIGEK